MTSFDRRARLRMPEVTRTSETTKTHEATPETPQVASVKRPGKHDLQWAEALYERGFTLQWEIDHLAAGARLCIKRQYVEHEVEVTGTFEAEARKWLLEQLREALRGIDAELAAKGFAPVPPIVNAAATPAAAS